MRSLFSSDQFRGFGPSFLNPCVNCALYQVHGDRPAALRKGVREECPRRPGVYGMLDAHGVLVYVGKAKNLRSRLLSYFRAQSRPRKARQILQEARSIVWEFVPSDFGALLRELELIQRWRPRLNVQGQPHRRQRVYVCLGRQPAPFLFLSRRPPAGLTGCYGPIVCSRKAREAIRRLNDWFQLRECPKPQTMIFADHRELFPVVRAAGCIRYEIGTCLGPCAAACSQRGYHERVLAVRDFLAGGSREPLESLERQMEAAAAIQAFEKAAALRDKLENIRWLRDRLDYLRLARQRNNFVYPVQQNGNPTVWYLIREGQVVSAQIVSGDRRTRQILGTSLETVYIKNRLTMGPGRGEEVDTLMLVCSWFRRFPQELARTLNPVQALNLCGRVALAS